MRPNWLQSAPSTGEQVFRGTRSKPPLLGYLCFGSCLLFGTFLPFAPPTSERPTDPPLLLPFAVSRTWGSSACGNETWTKRLLSGSKPATIPSTVSSSDSAAKLIGSEIRPRPLGSAMSRRRVAGPALRVAVLPPQCPRRS